MGKLKEEAKAANNEDVQEHQLEESEANYLRLLNLSLQYHTLGQKLLSGFLYYVCTHRLGYTPGTNLQFEFDFSKQDNKMIVKVLPPDPAQAAEVAGQAPAPAEPTPQPEA